MKKYARPVLVSSTIMTTVAYSIWYFSPSIAVTAAEPVDVTLGGRKVLAMPGELTAYHSLQELQAASTNGVVQLNRPVDFSKQKLVRVGWRAMAYSTQSADQAVAPAVGGLVNTSRSGGTRILFHIDQPLQESTAGQRVHELAHHQQVGESWFLVDRNAQVRYSEFARPIKFDLCVLLLLFLVVHVTFWPLVKSQTPVPQPAFEPSQPKSLEWATGG
jgi:hypothetical protein